VTNSSALNYKSFLPIHKRLQTNSDHTPQLQLPIDLHNSCYGIYFHHTTTAAHFTMPAAHSMAGLEWKKHFCHDLEPTWTVEPDLSVLKIITRRELSIPDDMQCEVKFLAGGALNKVYIIDCGGDIKHVIRVSLPVQPHFKTMSEFATITYVRHHTDIPAPKTSVGDASNKNELGFE
jgi:hypothetical protein